MEVYLLAIEQVAFVFGASSGLTHGPTFRVLAWVSWVGRTYIWVTRQRSS